MARKGMARPKPPARAQLAALQAGADAALKAGNIARAVALFRQVAAAVPNDPGAHYNLGLALGRAGEAGEAAHRFSLAARAPGLRDGALRNLSRQIRLVPAFPPGAIDRAGLASGLASDVLERQPFVRAILDHACRTEPLAAILETGRRDGWDAAAEALLSRDGAPALADRVMLDALATGVNVDADLEYLLTAARAALLARAGAPFERTLGGFAVALARQAFNNEHVWPAGAKEREAVASGLAAVRDAAPDALPALGALVTVLLAYMPAWELFPGTDAEDARIAAIRPREVQALVRTQLADRAEERALADAMPGGAARLDDPVSRAVAAQYEANPYPRWLSTDLPAAGRAREGLSGFFSSDELAILEGRPRLLIAGCGTGRQAVDLATQFGPETAITAIDLSRASLGYAARMAKRYGIGNVAFRHADILALADWTERFEVVVSDGVLHHMAEPMRGWRVLADRLAPGGLIRISLYSALARQLLDRDRARTDGADALDPGDADALRAFRRRMFDANRADPDALPYTAYDWYTLSTFRDLVVHVEEHRYTVPDIAAALDELDLEFRGFLLPSIVMRAFRTRFPDEGALRDLDAWWAFEQAEPATFANMYAFWCRKPG